MELINKQDVIDGLMEDVTSYGLMDDEGNIESGCKDKDVIAMVESLQSVEAIPIEWINHYMDTNLTKVSLFYSCMSEFVRDWKKEQEKTNDSD